MILGIDIGSRTIKVVAIEDGEILDYQIIESSFNPHLQSMELIKKYHPEKIIATGYGRHLAKKYFAQDIITEIKAHSLGAKYFFPKCRTVIDIGGQDSKVIALDENGKIKNFLMNDKCAAGTGRFLEIMAISLGFSLDQFGEEALKGENNIKINSMCTVFAESEVISLKNLGYNPNDIAKAVHLSVAERVAAMVHRIVYEEDIVFSGGVANNKCIVKIFEEIFDKKMFTPFCPDIVGAVGAAISIFEDKKITHCYD
jgi:predicted CoA-substrate-specific enzyme activase